MDDPACREGCRRPQHGKASIEESEARYGQALHESVRELASLWVDWLAAERGRELATENLQAVQENLGAVEKRTRAGDRIIAESQALKVAQTQMRMAQAQSERARAEKVPDPTVGVYAALEAGGRERILGIAFSIPLPGGLRDSRSAKAVAAVEVACNGVDLKRREFETETAAALVTARGSCESAGPGITRCAGAALVTARGSCESQKMVGEGALAMQENAKLVQRACRLGEGDLQTLLLARRQVIAAANNALQAKAGSLKAYLGLLVDRPFHLGSWARLKFIPARRNGRSTSDARPASRCPSTPMHMPTVLRVWLLLPNRRSHNESTVA